MSCDPTCFNTISDNCVDYTGESFSSLGVSQGGSIVEALEAIMKKLTELDAKVTACSFCYENSTETTDQTLESLFTSDENATEIENLKSQVSYLGKYVGLLKTEVDSIKK